MVHPGARAVFGALEARGGLDCARFVGGCVRNAVLRRPVSDVDIATQLEPDTVLAALAAAEIRAIPTGYDHGVVTAVAAGRAFEIATLRRDVATDGRRAAVAFTQDWAQDAARRDFRLNALYADRDGRLFDPTGEGLADARAGRVIFVGDPSTRIAEDALRILRFFRFQAWYGRGPPDAAALAACTAERRRLSSLSGERVAKELLTLLAAADPGPVLRVMSEAGVLAAVLPEARNLERCVKLAAVENGLLFSEDALLRLAALLADDPAQGRTVAAQLRLSNVERARLVAALDPKPPLVSWMSPRQLRRAVYGMGLQAFCDRVMLHWAASDRPAAAVQWRALLPMAQGWTVPVLPLTGEEVVAAGVPQGPMVGEVLRAVEAWWVDHDFTTDKLSVIEALKAVVQGLVY
jgi:poly(A) polymerase